MNLGTGRREKWQDLLSAGIAVGMLIALLSILFGYHYEMNDDVVIKDILSGSYTGTPDGHCIQMLYPIGVLVAYLYRIARGIPWYGLFLLVAQFGACFLIFYRSLRLVHRRVRKSAVLLIEYVLIFTYFSYWLVNLQYSMTCAFLVAAAILSFVSTDTDCAPMEFIWYNIGTVLLLVLAFCVRTEMMLLLCPFVAFAVLVYWCGRDRVERRFFFEADNLLRYGGFLVVLALGMTLVWGIDRLAYSDGQWAEFRKLFDARTQLYDFYGVPDYAGNETFYDNAGIGEAGQALLDNYNYLLNENVDSNLLEQIVSYDREQLGVGYFKVPLREGFLEYVYWHVGHFGASVLPAVALLYVLLVLMGVFDRQWGLLWKLPLLFVIRSALWMYLILRGRCPERIAFGLLLVEAVCLIYLLVQHLVSREHPVRGLLTKADRSRLALRSSRQDLFVTIGVTVVLCGVMLLFLPGQLRALKEEKESRNTVNAEWQQLQEYCASSPSVLYLLDVYSTVDYSEKVWSGDSNRMKNYDYAGGWASKSPLQEEKLSRWGLSAFSEQSVPQVAEGIVDSGRVFWVSRRERPVDWLAAWYTFQGMNVQAVSVDKFGGKSGDFFMVYRLESISEEE